MRRIDYDKVDSKAFAGLKKMDQFVAGSLLEPALCDLVKLRASQINGCAYCVDLHAKNARKNGETEQRLYSLSVWRETPYYSKRERTALAWVEALTRIAEEDYPDDLYRALCDEFKEDAIALVMLIISINNWNRLAISFGRDPVKDEPEGSEGLMNKN